MHDRSGEWLFFGEIRKHRSGEQTDGGHDDVEMVLFTGRSGQTPPLHIVFPTGRADFGSQPEVRPQTVVVGATLEIRKDSGCGDQSRDQCGFNSNEYE